MGIKASFKRFFDLDDDLHNREQDPQPVDPSSAPTKKFRSRSTPSDTVVNMPQMQEEPSIMWVDPMDYEDVLLITDHLKNRQRVVFNLQNLSQDEATRMIDFLSGAVHITEGTIQKVKPFTFFCALEPVDLSEPLIQSIEQRYP